MTEIKQYVSNINGYYVKDAEARESIDAKADAGTTLSDYGITDAYTKTEVDTAVSNKADAGTTLEDYGITDAYTKEETNDKFSLSIFETVPTQSISASVGTLDTTSSNIQVAKNTDGTLAKVYGRVKTTFNNNTGSHYVSFPTSLRPEEDITISTSVLARTLTTGGSENFTFTSVFITSMTIATDGTVTSGSLNVINSATQIDLFFQPFLLFVKNFGDEETPEE